jgi:hypothetical protein
LLQAFARSSAAERQGSKDSLSGTRPVATRSQNRLRQRTKTGDAAEAEAIDTILGLR